MADITMCNGDECNVKNSCYRYTATPNPFRQSYFNGIPIVDDKCNHYINDKTLK